MIKLNFIIVELGQAPITLDVGSSCKVAHIAGLFF